MAGGDLIDFEVIEGHKENIQALPSGRSAKALAALYSPPLTSGTQSPAANDAHSAARAEFEEELALIDEADDPLDIYDRYVKWTLDTYPSAQSTPQSQLAPLHQVLPFFNTIRQRPTIPEVMAALYSLLLGCPSRDVCLPKPSRSRRVARPVL